MPEFAPAAILEVLARHDVDYVLIGGYAGLISHGALLQHMRRGAPGWMPLLM